jgi:hypothetical protein
MANYKRKADTEETGATTTYSERVVTAPSEQLETESGHTVAMQGMHILQSNSRSNDVIVVHPVDLSNSNIWIQV